MQLSMRLIIFSLLLLVSCSSSKKLVNDKTKVVKEQIQSGEQVVKRASDTVLLTIPTIKYKDTIIYKSSRWCSFYIKIFFGKKMR